MKKWNRILAAVLTLSLTAGLTACGGSTSDATANNASAADEGTVSNGSSEVYRTLDEIKESGTINILGSDILDNATKEKVGVVFDGSGLSLIHI